MAAFLKCKEDSCEVLERKHAGGAAAKVKGGESGVHLPGPFLYFLADSLCVGLKHALLRDFGVEVAVGAKALAKGYVNVDHTT